MQAIPSKRALNWQEQEMGMFIHFGVNTFYHQEWGDGSEDAARFFPAELDCRQWARIAAECGFKYMVLTAKHHDGFCLWPTKTTHHSVSAAFKRDVVAEFVAACREYGLKPGLYLSPWDRHEPCYKDREAYDRFYLNQLSELTQNYGPLFELWFDGAGSEGRVYAWEEIMAALRQNQPEAVVFNMGRPDIRWVGNEDGLAPYPCWNRAGEARKSMFTQDMERWLEDTPEYIPAECDVPIRKGHWFYRPGDEECIRTAEELLDIYERSVGRGCNLLLNISPDERGLLPEADVAALKAFTALREQKYASPQAETAGAWGETTLTLPVKGTLYALCLQEDLTQGENIRAFTLTAETENGAHPLFTGSAVGHKLLLSFPPVAAQAVTLHITQSEGTPRIRSLKAFTRG